MTIIVEGMEELQRELRALARRANGELSNRFVTLALQGIAMNTMPYVPVDTSNLINSEFRRTWRGRSGYAGEIGYSADYATDVHDGGPKNWQKPGAEDKFLEKGVADFVRDDLSALLASAYGDLTA